MQRQQQVVALFFQQGGVGDGAGGDDAHDFALDRAFAGGGVADLFADGDGLAHLHQPRQVLLGGVVRHARHLDRLPVGSAALGERDVEQLGCAHCIVMEQLVEIAHAVEQQHVRMLRLDAQVLLHHGSLLGVDGQVVHSCSAWRKRQFTRPNAMPVWMVITRTLLHGS